MTEAIIGLIGVIVGSIITVAKEVWLDWRNRRQLARHSAILLISTLDKYANECIEVIMDDGISEGRPAGQTSCGQEYYKPVVEPPEPIKYSDEIVWRSLPDEIIERALMLPSRARNIDEQIKHAAEFSEPPDHSEFFHVRRLGYARLGLEALSLSEKLQRKYKIRMVNYNLLNPDWDAKRFLEEFIQKNEKQRTEKSD